MSVEAPFISLVQSPRFAPGQIVMTAGGDELVQQGRLNASVYLQRHLSGDRGDLNADDKRLNDAALDHGDRLLSSYQVTPDLKIWIITEWDRSVTTVLLPHEY